ncbi:MAG: energy transducer TonB [Saprospiraceae bacterium]|nr:energy transducer TonB [Saprospiraceae bacterium]
MKHIFLSLMLCILSQGTTVLAQETRSPSIECSVHKVYPSFSISRQKLVEANTLVDLNKHYKPSWIKDYVSVEVSATVDGKKMIIKSKNDTLTNDQKNMLKNIDTNTSVSFLVKYIPDNNLKNKEVRKYDCEIPVEPEKEARFPGGEVAMKKYLKAYAFDKLPENSFEEYAVGTVKFTVNEEGQIINPHFFWPIENDEVEKILMSTICNMPVWEPAEFADGTKTKQELVLTVGDMRSCVINMLNIHQDKPN